MITLEILRSSHTLHREFLNPVSLLCFGFFDLLKGKRCFPLQIQPTVSVVPSHPSTHTSPRVPRKMLPQERLERLWAMLKMPDHQRLDMAIRYSTEAMSDRFIKALDAWDSAAKVVLEREALMAELEAFERLASDPNRFFVKGHQGSSKARMQEAAERENLLKVGYQFSQSCS